MEQPTLNEINVLTGLLNVLLNADNIKEVNSTLIVTVQNKLNKLIV